MLRRSCRTCLVCTIHGASAYQRFTIPVVFVRRRYEECVKAQRQIALPMVTTLQCFVANPAEAAAKAAEAAASGGAKPASIEGAGIGRCPRHGRFGMGVSVAQVVQY